MTQPRSTSWASETLVDVIAHVDDAFLKTHDLVKGAMTLIDAGRADDLYARMPPAVEVSGGSAGNTIAGVASLGGRSAYIGKVCDDQLGRVYRHDIRAAGVTFDASRCRDGIDRPMSHRRDARRAADDADVPWRRLRPGAPRTSTLGSSRTPR